MKNAEKIWSALAEVIVVGIPPPVSLGKQALALKTAPQASFLSVNGLSRERRDKTGMLQGMKEPYRNLNA